jgi:hypothetical protein
MFRQGGTPGAGPDDSYSADRLHVVDPSRMLKLVHLVGLVCFVYLVDLVHLNSFVQPNKLDKPNNGLLTLEESFNILPRASGL